MAGGCRRKQSGTTPRQEGGRSGNIPGRPRQAQRRLTAALLYMTAWGTGRWLEPVRRRIYRELGPGRQGEMGHGVKQTWEEACGSGIWTGTWIPIRTCLVMIVLT